ncbi:hypothetical protein VTK73DRAFT_2362 [Phialemonium thermophilum]|uniref:Uncharacterized protein n=1 Tax=Phialemonium thermophilum TaxID=223376 RepID=A0ABR3X5F2_9PEZI
MQRSGWRSETSGTSLSYPLACCKSVSFCESHDPGQHTSFSFRHECLTVPGGSEIRLLCLVSPGTSAATKGQAKLRMSDAARCSLHRRPEHVPILATVAHARDGSQFWGCLSHLAYGKFPVTNGFTPESESGGGGCLTLSISSRNNGVCHKRGILALEVE